MNRDQYVYELHKRTPYYHMSPEEKLAFIEERRNRAFADLRTCPWFIFSENETKYAICRACSIPYLYERDSDPGKRYGVARHPKMCVAVCWECLLEADFELVETRQNVHNPEAVEHCFRQKPISKVKKAVSQ